MQSSLSNHRAAGFTLIEMLVVAPLIILLLGVAIGFVVSLTGEGLVSRQRNENGYNIQAALDDIEQATTLATAIATNTGPIADSQLTGAPSGTTATPNGFISGTRILVLTSVATDKNPLDPSRSAVYNGSAPCNTNNTPYTYSTVFFVASNSALTKRTIMPSSGTPCQTPFQSNSCVPANVGTSPCQIRDEILMNNATSLSITYLNATGASVAPAQASELSIVLVASRSVAGQTVRSEGRATARLLNR